MSDATGAICATLPFPTAPAGDKQTPRKSLIHMAIPYVGRITDVVSINVRRYALLLLQKK